MKEWGKIKTGVIVTAAVGFLLLGAFFFSSYSLRTGVFTTENTYVTPEPAAVTIAVEGPPPFVVTHKPTPIPLKAIYMSSWVAGRKDLRDKLVKLIDDTELNAIVIDIKDYTGRIAFEVEIRS
jgi:hypothetical protein